MFRIFFLQMTHKKIQDWSFIKENPKHVTRTRPNQYKL
jgi:hypothetical protein